MITDELRNRLVLILVSLIIATFLGYYVAFVLPSKGEMPAYIASERGGTLSISQSEWELKYIDTYFLEAQFIITGAGALLGILFTHFIFGAYFPKRFLMQLIALGAAVTSAYSIWMGFRVINELRWLLSFKIGPSYWGQSRLNDFHMAQYIFLFLAISMFVFYLAEIISSKSKETVGS